MHGFKMDTDHIQPSFLQIPVVPQELPEDCKLHPEQDVQRGSGFLLQLKVGGELQGKTGEETQASVHNRMYFHIFYLILFTTVAQ